jgi:glycosyltransferase involved in cell wall biosynthesis
MEPVNISVVIPTYARPELLQRCVQAVRGQSCPGCFFEVIIVSDGPDGETKDLLGAIQAANPEFQLRFYQLGKRSGPAAARNLGWQQACGELVVFTDDDCIPAASWLAAYWRAFQSQHQELVAFTGKVEVPVPEKPTDYQKNVSHLATADFITANCAATKRALALVGGFDEEFPIAWREDSDLHFKLLEKNIPIPHVGDAVICHPARDVSWGVSVGEQRKSMFNALLFKKHREFYRAKIASGPVWIYYAIILSSIAAVLALIFKAKILMLLALSTWLLALAIFIVRRLRGTDVSFSHRLEMIITSILIPYLSVYWTLRGALRYKVFFL